MNAMIEFSVLFYIFSLVLYQGMQGRPSKPAAVPIILSFIGSLWIFALDFFIKWLKVVGRFEWPAPGPTSKSSAHLQKVSIFLCFDVVASVK
jgi:hypothetical protein